MKKLTKLLKILKKYQKSNNLNYQKRYQRDIKSSFHNLIDDFPVLILFIGYSLFTYYY
jgi:hypothetical protein